MGCGPHLSILGSTLFHLKPQAGQFKAQSSTQSPDPSELNPNSTLSPKPETTLNPRPKPISQTLAGVPVKADGSLQQRVSEPALTSSRGLSVAE